MITFDSPVATVLGDVGPQKAKRITQVLGLHTVGDLFDHFPRRYLATAELTRLGKLYPGQLITVVGEIERSELKTYQDRRSGRTGYRVEAVLATGGSGGDLGARLGMTFFAKGKHMAEHFQSKYRAGQRGLFLGKVSTFQNRWQLTNPVMFLFESDFFSSVASLPPLYPIYPLTKGVFTWDLERAVTFARTLVEVPEDPLPEAVREAHGLVDLRTAYDQVHAPATPPEAEAALHRFRFEEALVTQLVLARRRRAQQSVGTRTRDGGDGALLRAFDAQLPFELTAGQRRVGTEIEADLARPHPMNRLLQGEVGSGKTLVAVRAVLRVVDSGGQAALLAPTEVLAQQHHRSITAMLGELASGGMLGGSAVGTQVELLTGSLTKAQRRERLLRIASGEAGLVVGTHALLEDTVQFADLGLVVVDEQHRFGVEQRAALTAKGIDPPHVLVMTATPIPRTVAMTVFGDLETSTLDELPSGRAPIQTSVVNLREHPGWITRVWERVREEVGRGHQVYVVCPRISVDELEPGALRVVELDEDGQPAGEDDEVPLAAVEDVAPLLSTGPLSGLRVERLHGRMAPEEKDATMTAFAAGDIDVLVSTTVIEVGVDVHNATTMVILDADRFGVSQLHQLRGRVGRGGLPGLCLLVTHTRIGEGAESPSMIRLGALADSTDGFELSRLDLEQRREGDVLGSRQSGGRSQLRRLKVLRDEETILEARGAAVGLLEDDPELAAHPLLAREVAELEASQLSDFIDKS